MCVFCVVLNSDCWNGTANIHGFGGVPYSVNLSECQAICINNETCVAIDWDPYNAKGHTCMILRFHLTRPTTEDGYITHYVLNPACRRESCLLYNERSPVIRLYIFIINTQNFRNILWSPYIFIVR